LELHLPPLSADIEYGTISQWLKREGELIEQGQPIVEVEVDKVTQTIDAPASGKLTEIVAVAGDEVKVGGLLGVIEEGGA
jgi:2-oxoglutarate dehydrogenase E2 component (dihydrolipoamide succinyltransferase)